MNPDKFNRNHNHCMDRTGINYTPCTSLTHCPSICDCPVSACTAHLIEDHDAPIAYMPTATTKYLPPDETRTGILEWFDAECAKETRLDNEGPTQDMDYTLTTEKMDYEFRTMATCLACGTQTPWWHLPQMAIDQITQHVTREWMSH